MDHDQPEGGRDHIDQPPSPPRTWSAPAPPAAVHAPPVSPSSNPMSPAPGVAGPGARPRARLGVVTAAALGGALVGGALAGGIVAAATDGGTRTTVISEPAPVAARPSTALAKPGDIRTILAKVEPAVVRIDVTSDPDTVNSERGTGTGFIVSPDGVIVTNAHVVNAETGAAAREIEVTLAAGDKVRGHLVGEDPAQDLAVIKVDRENLPVVELGNSDDLQVGDAVVAIGNALGIAGTPTVTSGIVSGLHRTVRVSSEETLVDALQTDAAINPGNSGGPLVDVDGRVIGINTAIADPGSSNNVGFAISISSARPVLDDLRAGRTPRIAYMGVYTQDVTPELARARKLTVASGAFVALVTPRAGAERAGLRRGDVMIQVDGEPIRSSDDVIRIVRTHRPGDSIQVVALRGDERKTFEVTLGDLPNA
jgi:putative serine protease PepD